MIISFLNQKGGVGNTTLSINVAACLTKQGHWVLLIDADKQGSASTWASNLTVKQVREAQEFKPSLKCGFVVSRKIGNTVIGRDIRSMAANTGIPILDAEIEQRVAFAESLTMGQTIFEWAAGATASREIEALTKEIERHVEEDVFSSTETQTANG